MEYFRRLKNFWFPDMASLVWLLLALPALYFFQTTLHEGSHTMAAFLVTGHFPLLAPFPHSDPDGRFLNGVTIGDSSTLVSVLERTDCATQVKSRFNRLAGFPATPQFLDLVLVAIFTLVFLVSRPASGLARFGLRTWYLGAMLDFMYNTVRGLVGGCNPATDWSKFMLQSDLSPGIFAVLTWIFWLAILSHFIWVYWSRWAREQDDLPGFWGYRWLAFGLGCVSLVAVLLSLLVNDPQINKASALFIIPLLVQAIAMAWYWVYFALTFFRF